MGGRQEKKRYDLVKETEEGRKEGKRKRVKGKCKGKGECILKR